MIPTAYESALKTLLTTGIDDSEVEIRVGESNDTIENPVLVTIYCESSTRFHPQLVDLHEMTFVISARVHRAAETPTFLDSLATKIMETLADPDIRTSLQTEMGDQSVVNAVMGDTSKEIEDDFWIREAQLIVLGELIANSDEFGVEGAELLTSGGFSNSSNSVGITSPETCPAVVMEETDLVISDHSDSDNNGTYIFIASDIIYTDDDGARFPTPYNWGGSWLWARDMENDDDELRVIYQSEDVRGGFAASGEWKGISIEKFEGWDESDDSTRLANWLAEMPVITDDFLCVEAKVTSGNTYVGEYTKSSTLTEEGYPVFVQNTDAGGGIKAFWVEDYTGNLYWVAGLASTVGSGTHSAIGDIITSLGEDPWDDTQEWSWFYIRRGKCPSAISNSTESPQVNIYPDVVDQYDVPDVTDAQGGSTLVLEMMQSPDDWVRTNGAIDQTKLDEGILKRAGTELIKLEQSVSLDENSTYRIRPVTNSANVTINFDEEVTWEDNGVGSQAGNSTGWNTWSNAETTLLTSATPPTKIEVKISNATVEVDSVSLKKLT